MSVDGGPAAVMLSRRELAFDLMEKNNRCFKKFSFLGNGTSVDQSFFDQNNFKTSEIFQALKETFEEF